MNCAVDVMPTLNGIPYFGAATVVEPQALDGRVKVSAQLMGDTRVVSVRLAVQLGRALSSDEQVLIAGSDINDLFIIGVISSAYAAANQSQVLKSRAGAYASVDTSSAGNETLQVFSSNQELLFEYDPLQHKSKVNISKGDLELCTEQGDIKLNAGGEVQISAHAIELSSQRLNAKVTYAKFVFQRLETFTDTLIEQAKNVYRSVAQLTQLRTGRMRTFVDETYQFKANKAFLKSEDDFKIKGEKIHLG